MPHQHFQSFDFFSESYVYMYTIPTSHENINWRKVVIKLTPIAKLCRFMKLVFQLDACLNHLPTQITTQFSEMRKLLTIPQTTKFRLFQTQRVC